MTVVTKLFNAVTLTSTSWLPTRMRAAADKKQRKIMLIMSSKVELNAAAQNVDSKKPSQKIETKVSGMV